MAFYCYYDDEAEQPGWRIATSDGVSDVVRQRCTEPALIQGIALYTDDTAGALAYLQAELRNPARRITCLLVAYATPPRMVSQ